MREKPVLEKTMRVLQSIETIPQYHVAVRYADLAIRRITWPGYAMAIEGYIKSIDAVVLTRD